MNNAAAQGEAGVAGMPGGVGPGLTPLGTGINGQPNYIGRNDQMRASGQQQI